MIKIFIVFASILAIAFYFLRDQDQAAPATKAIKSETGKLETLAPLPGAIKESSGIEMIPEKGDYLTHNDANNQPYLYEIDENGKLIKTYKFKLPNVDWEDLTRDDNGNLYIGDIGNNNSKRSELAIYKVAFSEMANPQAIRFTYEDYKGKPSKKDKNSFDSEAFFWYADNLYLISKDRNGSREAKVYQLPDKPGNYTAKKIGTIKMNERVTSACISPDARKVVLLSEGKIHLYRDVDNPESFFEGNPDEIQLSGAGQTEAVTFKDNNTLILTSEGGNLFRYTL